MTLRLVRSILPIALNITAALVFVYAAVRFAVWTWIP